MRCFKWGTLVKYKQYDQSNCFEKKSICTHKVEVHKGFVQNIDGNNLSNNFGTRFLVAQNYKSKKIWKQMLNFLFPNDFVILYPWQCNIQL